MRSRNSEAAYHFGERSSRALPFLARIGAFFAVGFLEALAVYSARGLPDAWQLSPLTSTFGRVAAIAVCSILIAVGIAWPKWRAIISAFKMSVAEARILPALSTSILFCLLSLFARGFLALDIPPVASAIASSIAAALDLASLVALTLVIIPASFWRWLTRTLAVELAASSVIAFAGVYGREFLHFGRGNSFLEGLWAPLSDATIQLSYWMLSRFEGGAFIEPSKRIIGAKAFSVEIFGPCSGYEGMIVVALFLTGYIWIFRRSLRFPNIFLLLPIAMGTIWLLNSFRIAMLVFIGANYSPAVALGGFHSQFGWISFLLVSLPIMIAAPRLSFFAAGSHIADPARKNSASLGSVAEANPPLLYLAPFIAMLAAQILVNSAAPHEHALYPIKVIAIAAALFAFRHAYLRIWSSPALSSLLFGAIAGGLWIATDPHASAATPLQIWTSETAPAALMLWLVFRAIGTVVMVPIAEELAFRGFLYRFMFSAKFEKVDPKTFGIVALIVSSALFGLLHERWLAGALAGLLYALLMVRHGRLSDAIAAHMTTNAVIFAWAVAAGQWSLL